MSEDEPRPLSGTGAANLRLSRAKTGDFLMLQRATNWHICEPLALTTGAAGTAATAVPCPARRYEVISMENSRPLIATIARFVTETSAVLLVVAALFYVELVRNFGADLTVPTLIVYGSVALAAALGGLRVSLATATLAAAYFIHGTMDGPGAGEFASEIAPLVGGVAISYVIGYALGSRHDRMIRLEAALHHRERDLVNARNAAVSTLEPWTNLRCRTGSAATGVQDEVEAAVTNSSVGVFVVNRNGRITTANRTALSQIGLAEARELSAHSPAILDSLRFYSPGDPSSRHYSGPLADTLERGVVRDDLECRVSTPDGQRRRYRCCLAPMLSGDEIIAGALVFLLDMAQSGDVDRDLKQRAQRVLKTREDDRGHIANVLHDEVAQHLTAIRMHLHAAARKSNGRTDLEAGIDLTDALTDMVRKLSFEFRPAVLDDLGLAAAISWDLSQQQRECVYQIALDADEHISDVSPDVATACFRVVHESVANAICHAKASSLTVRIRRGKEQLRVDIVDDGCGFDYNRVSSAEGSIDGHGLLSIGDAVRLLDGTFSVSSGAGRGTQVTACFPIG